MSSFFRPVSRALLLNRNRIAAAFVVLTPGMYTPSSLLGQNTYPWPQTGNVGIGTSSPGATLQVSGTTLLGGGGASNWLPWSDGSDYLQLTTGKSFNVQSIPASFAVRFTINESGNMFVSNAVGIGTSNFGNCGSSTAQTCMLTVNGAIGAKEVVVNTGIADYVFAPDYRLRPLTEVASFIKEHHHLPEIPSEAEVKEKGISVGDMQAKLLAKIEELTLHLIEANERIARLEVKQQQQER